MCPVFLRGLELEPLYLHTYVFLNLATSSDIESTVFSCIRNTYQSSLSQYDMYAAQVSDCQPANSTPLTTQAKKSMRLEDMIIEDGLRR